MSNLAEKLDININEQKNEEINSQIIDYNLIEKIRKPIVSINREDPRFQKGMKKLMNALKKHNQS